MTDEKTQSAPVRRRARNAWIFAVPAAVFLIWILHPVVFSWVLTKTLETWASGNHLSFSAEKVDARFDGPVVLREVRLRSRPGSGLATALDISSLEWHWAGLSSLFSDGEVFIRDLTIKGLTGIWDCSSSGEASQSPMIGISPQRWIPREIFLGVPSLELLGKNEKWSVRDFALSLSENMAGQMDAGSLSLRLESYTKSLGPVHARTAWKNGTLWLAGMEVTKGVTVENFSLDFLHGGGPAISLAAACFGGSLRCDLILQTSGSTLDMAAWASGIPLDQTAEFFGIPGEITGKLAEGRFTYRGNPDRPADAEASLRLVADGFQWNKRGWESLEVGASLIHRRLVVTGFDLRQKANSVNFAGEISLAEGWSQISQSPFLINFRADIHELGSLAGLLGGPLDEAAGRMTASGSVTGRPGELDGFLNIEASDLAFRSLPPGSLRVKSVFKKNEIDVVACDLYSRKDTASIRGTIGIAAPHDYAAELDARVADLSVYLVPFHAPGAEQIYSGALDLRWQGDGNFKSHSGAFDLRLREFVSRFTPSGLTGKFAGTYSPQNLYFSIMGIEDGPLKLDSRATVAGSGVTLKDVELKTGSTPLLDGAAFFPIDLFSVFAGTDWCAATDPVREAYVRLVTSKDLGLQSLLHLAGQDIPVDGKLSITLQAGGPPASLSATGDLSIRDLTRKSADSETPPSSLSMKFLADKGRGALNAVLQPVKSPAVTLDAHLPFGLVKTAVGVWKWTNPEAPFDALLDFPRANLTVFRPFLPDSWRLNGSVAGRLAFSGTTGVPRTTGKIEIKGGHLEFSPLFPALEKTDASLAFEGDHMRIERFVGGLGGGTFEVSGGIGLSNPGNPLWDLQFRGERIVLMRKHGLKLLANVDASWKGDNAAGIVNGTVRLMDGRIFKRLELVPQLAPVSEESPDAGIIPDFPRVPESFSHWALDLKIENLTPILIPGKIGSGEIIPGISLRGTLGQPLPVGRITLKDVQVFLPDTTMDISEGRVDFLPDSPWIPLLDVRGHVRTPDLEIQAYAFGPLNEKKLILRSDPPLSQEALVLVLTGGVASPGPGFNVAGAGREPLFPALLFARTPEWLGADVCPVLDRLLMRAVSSHLLWDRTTLPRRFRLMDNLDEVPEREDRGLFPSAATYTWRFR